MGGSRAETADTHHTTLMSARKLTEVSSSVPKPPRPNTNLVPPSSKTQLVPIRGQQMEEHRIVHHVKVEDYQRLFSCEDAAQQVLMYVCPQVE